MSRVDTANLRRFETHNRSIVAFKHRKALNPIARDRQGYPAPGLIAVREREAPGTDHKAIAAALVTAGFFPVALAESGEPKLPFECTGTDAGTIEKLQRAGVHPGRHFKAPTLETGGHHGIEVNHPAGQQNETDGT